MSRICFKCSNRKTTLGDGLQCHKSDGKSPRGVTINSDIGAISGQSESLKTNAVLPRAKMSYMDSPRREPVPPFGAWRLEDPSSPVIDYTEVFTRARASRLGCMPQENYDDEEYYSQSDDTPRYASGSRVMSRHSPRRKLLHYFVCGARAQAVA